MHGLRAALPAAARAAQLATSTSTTPSPTRRSPQLLKTIDAKELAANAGYSRPHTLHCGPDGIFLSCLGGADGNDGPGGIALLDHATFDVLRAWETDRGPQYLAYDAWWHLNQNVAITSEWGTPSMIEDGIVPGAAAGPEVRPRAALLGPRRRPAPADRRPRRAAPDGAGAAAQSHDPEATWGFVGVVVSTEDLSASIWRWHRDGDTWTADKVITIPAEPADPDCCRRRCSPSAPCRRWSPTSTSPSTTACSTSPAGAPASSSSTTCRTRRTRARSARSASAGSSGGSRTPRRRTSGWPAGRRWSR